MKFKNTYIGRIIYALASLLTGLKTTLIEFFTPKVTEQYPENRATLKISERHRAMLYMPVDENGNNRCIACVLCQSACPNGTITVKTRTITDEETGKSRKVLDEYIYDLGSCMFCQLCVNACPKDAIAFNNKFENAVFDRKRLIMKLNK
ncbi:MAG: 4Fe-4S dicluster domain-containing protein [Bacteroidaceae bacterium]|nr:4Fe-4S dicluster domain-containing protein [Bacteroidaceae bacterium]